MKKYTWILGGLMAMAITACTSDELMERPEQHPTEGEVVSVTAYVPGNNPDSRVAFTDTKNTEENKARYTLSWETLDQFSVIRDGRSNTFTKEDEEDNTFTGVLPGSSGTYYAIYPAIADGNADASVVPFDLSTQTGALNASKTYMRATSTGGQTFSFSHCTAILKATFTGLPDDATITQIKVTTPDAYNVKGTINLTDGTLEGDDENNTITIGSDDEGNDESNEAVPSLAEATEGETGTTSPQREFYIYLPPTPIAMPASEEAETFTIEVKVGSKTYEGTISRKGAIVAGKLYTATIKLTEVITYCNLPKGTDFRSAILAALYNNPQLTKIEFKANSNEISGTQIGTCGAYLVPNTTTSTLEIHTAASVFVFPENCASMFNGNTFYEETGTQPLLRVTSIKFNDCIDTSKVTSMSNMFRDLSALKELDLRCFNTSNVTDMSLMFAYCSNLEMLNLSSFNVGEETNLKNMLKMMSNLENGETAKVYVPDPNPFEGKNTGINTNNQGQPVTPYAEYVNGTPQ